MIGSFVMPKKPVAWTTIIGLVATCLTIIVGWSMAYAKSQSDLEKRLVHIESEATGHLRIAEDHIKSNNLSFNQIETKWDIVEKRLDTIQVQVAEVKVILDRMEKSVAARNTPDAKTPAGITQPVAGISTGSPPQRQ
jgi:hypothetical protein